MTEKVTVGRMVGDALSEGSSRRAPGLRRRTAAALHEVPLFAGLSARHIRRLAANAEEVHYGAGRTIVSQGSRGDSFFVILEGTAKVRRGTRTIGRLEPGDFFGEMALLDGRPRSATVIAETPLVTVRLLRSAFNKAIDTEPAMARGILAELAARVRRLESPQRV